MKVLAFALLLLAVGECVEILRSYILEFIIKKRIAAFLSANRPVYTRDNVKQHVCQSHHKYAVQHVTDRRITL
jgi:hypothetical protein